MILRAEDLTVGYRGRPVGSGLTLAAAPGRVTALLGPNGGGKTTLLRTLLGLLPPLAGRVWLDGRSLAELSAAERARRVAYVPQSTAATFAFTAFEVVLMGRTMHCSPFSRPGAGDRAAANAALDRLGIARLAERPVTLLSGGERQLVLVARALAVEPRVIVLDEPTASLDFGNGGRVLRELRGLAADGLAILFTTHDPNGALRHADDAVLLGDGRITARGPVDDVLRPSTLSNLYGVPVAAVGTGRDRAFLPG